LPKVPNRIVHTGGGAGGKVHGIEE
jgi:hypothetical protein